MKTRNTNKINRWIAALLSVLLVLVSCSGDDEFLKEERKDTLTIENAFTNKAQFETLLASIYDIIQSFYNADDGDVDAWPLGLGTDVMFSPRSDTSIYNDWSLLNSFDAYSSRWYTWQYTIISYANTAIKLAQGEKVSFDSEESKNAILAEAKFFRAFAYRNLANIFGGVPILDTPITESKVDFVRASREDCWKFAKEDLEFARIYLPIKENKPGKLIRAAADHLLAELNISLQDYDGAIAAATRVIDGSDGDYKLMTGRFGARKDVPNKNIYWDLYRMGNQNKDAGNTEAIWVAQFEYNVPGGTANFGRPLIERMMWSNWWNFRKAGYPGVAVDSTGRGVAFLRGTDHVNYTVWKTAGTDLRNTEAVIKRKFYFAADVESYKKGELIPKAFLTTKEDTLQFVYPNWQKFGTDQHLDARADNGYVRDFYVMRLSETYLLRAEAYLAKGSPDMAANDINVVRTRAQAPPATTAEVDIDYILDERIRELYGEEFRMLTLARLGLVYDRTSRLGYHTARMSIKPHNNLFPIPQSEIDRNVGAKLEQNPGY